VFQGNQMTAKNGKPCKKCGTSEWYSNGSCKYCSAEYGRKWRAANPEKERTRHQRNRHKRIDEMTEDARERERERNRKRRAENPEGARARHRKWESANREWNRQRINEWMRSHPEERARYEHARRSRKSASGGSYTVAEWKGLVAHYGNKCLCCGRSDVALTVDHVVPVSKGGTSNIDNLQPLCLSCNSKKQDKIIDYRPGKGLGRWIQQKLFR
jgi:5-methylcytosine-specific restriction endonuclease McrA